jgi:hypothetical protein
MTVPSNVPATRRAWHAIAELVLAGPQYRRSGTIRLRVSPGGFATTKDPGVSVVGGELVGGSARVPADGGTCTALARALGVEAGAPEGLYHGGSEVGADEVLTVDAAAAQALADSLAAGQAALLRFAPEQTPVLWPEHFDLGITLDEVNYGVSLGDGYLAEPYAYVGPWQPRPGPFWNAPFGAARPLSELASVGDFFAEGRDLAAAAPGRA